MNRGNHSGDPPVAERMGGAVSLPILTRKLYRPPVTPDLEQRARPMERLDHNRQRPLTLISAPAGCGKTMLASTWLQASGCPSAWLSLGEADNDLHAFVSYLLAGVLSASATLEPKTRALLEAPCMAYEPVPVRWSAGRS